MSTTDRSRRSSRQRKGAQFSDSEDEEANAAEVHAAEMASAGGNMREHERLAKIQEKNRKAQQKFRERRKEKMLGMEKMVRLNLAGHSVLHPVHSVSKIGTLEQQVLQLRTEKDHLQEQLAIEKRVSAERAAVREPQVGAALTADGLQDFDPIDMSFLPMWQGLQLSNDKIRAMPIDTLKMLIQTILQDLRNRLAGFPEGQGGAAALSSAVSAAFAFLNRCYLVEPVRHRRVVADLLSSHTAPAAAAQGDESSMTLTREQELAIGKSVEAYETTVQALEAGRREAADAIKAPPASRATELESMRAFLHVYAQVEAVQESLKRENEALVAFLTDVGRILGPTQLTQAMLVSSVHQDIMTMCQAVHKRVRGQCGSGGHGGATAPSPSPPGAYAGAANGSFAVSPSTGNFMGGMSGSWLGAGSRGDLPGSAALLGTGSLALQDNFLFRGIADSQAFDQAQLGSNPGLPGAVPGTDNSAMPAGLAAPLPQAAPLGNTGGQGQKRPRSPGKGAAAFDSPFLYGPARDASGHMPVAPFHGPVGNPAAVAPGTGAGAASARPAKVPKSEAEAGIATLSSPHDRHDSFLELFRTIGDAQARQGDGSGALPGSSNGAQGRGGSSASARNPADLVSQLNQMSPGAVQGLKNLLSQSQSSLAAAQTAQSGAAAAAPTPSAQQAQAALANSAIISELETLLHSKEGSRTLEILAQDLNISRQLSAGDNNPAMAPGVPSAHTTPAPAAASSPAAPVRAPPAPAPSGQGAGSPAAAAQAQGTATAAAADGATAGQQSGLPA